MSTQELSTAQRIAKLEKANATAKQQSAQRNKELLELRNQHALENATLWLAIDRMESTEPGIHHVSIAGVTSVIESRQGGFNIKLSSRNNCEIQIKRLETEEQVFLHLAAGQEINIAFVTRYKKGEYITSYIFRVFDSLSGAEEWKRTQTHAQALGPLALL